MSRRSGSCPIRVAGEPPYNWDMTTTPTHPAHAVAAGPPRFSVAGIFLEALARQDFAALGTTLSDTAHLSALVPMGLKQWDGAEGVRGAFTGWFGDTTDYEVVEAVIGEIGPRLHLRWRLRLRAERLGAGWFVVEQQVYADTDDTGRISRLRLLCSGYCPEQERITRTEATR